MELTFSVIPPGRKKVRLSKNELFTFRFLQAKRKPEDERRMFTEKGSDKLVEFTSSSPLVFKLKGSCICQSGRRCLIDFGEFGAFEIEDDGSAEIRMSIMPYRAQFGEADWDPSNRVVIQRRRCAR